MSIYQNILVALDLNSPADAQLLQHAHVLAKQYGAKLSLLYAIEPLNFNVSTYVEPIVLASDEELTKQAAMDLDQLAEKYQLMHPQKIIKIGHPKQVIIEYANQLHTDLIVVGNHGRHGLSLMLLGSTANTVLHQAKCDVLMVNLMH